MNIKKAILISVISVVSLILLSIYLKKPDKVSEVEKPEIQIISKFMIDESIAPIQHVAAGLFSLPAMYQIKRTHTENNFILPNGENVYAECFYHENRFGDVWVIIYKRIVDYPNKGDSQLHLLFKTIDQKDNWYEIDVHGTLTGFGTGKNISFWTNPPYGADRFKNVSVHTYRENQFWTDQLFETMLVSYYQFVTPLAVDGIVKTKICYRATGEFFYSYFRDFNQMLHFNITDNNRNKYKVTASMDDKNYQPYKAPWREDK